MSENKEFKQAGIATVYCNGGCNKNKSCTVGCTGCGACVEACPFDAIHLTDDKVALVDESKCKGCGACVKACEQNIIRVRLAGAFITPLCSNTSMGKDALSCCDNSCIACRACEKICPAGACKVVDNRARIADVMCVGCGACISACKRGVIKDKRGIFTSVN